MGDDLKDCNPVFYTGDQNASQKDAALNRFVNGDSRVFVCSLRSGEGLDGLQHASHTCVFGRTRLVTGCSLSGDWANKPRRAEAPCQAYYLVSDYGADPIMSSVLGVKKNQSDGLIGSVQLGPVRTVDRVKCSASGGKHTWTS